jgi:3-oxoacyl-[acyl-carrier protein] reductase
MTERFAGKVAIVTGAGHGIGKAYALRLAQEGAAVVIAEIDGTAADATAAEFSAAGHRAIAVQTDVADEGSTQAMAAKTIETFGGIDILVNNAALFASVPMSRVRFEAIDPAEWDHMMNVNLKGVWNCCRAVVPSMRERGGGKIVNISSSTVWERTPTRIHYVTSKAGVIGFTRVLAVELGAENITVNCVSPGSTLSEADPSEAVIKLRSSAASARAIPRLQRPEDLVGAVAFFCSSDSDFITGQTLVVDGGSVLH